jgi:hypothetical protein
LLYASNVVEVVCALVSFLVAWESVAPAWTMVGRLFLGAEVPPFAFIGTVWNGLWSVLWPLAVGAVATMATRLLGLVLVRPSQA